MKKGFNKNLMIVYLGIGISVISIVAVIIIATTQLNKKNYSNITTTTPTATPTVTTTPQVTTNPVNGNALLTIKIDASSDTAGSIWNIVPQSLKRTEFQLGNPDNKAIKVIAWSKDNAYLALASNKNGMVIISFFDTVQNKTLESTVEYSGKMRFNWIDASTFAVLDYSRPIAPVFKKISLPNLQVTETSYKANLNMAMADMSPDTNKIIYAESTVNIEPIFFNKQTLKKVDMSLLGLKLDDFQFGFWSDDNNYIFYTKSGIYSLDATVLNITQLASLSSAELNPLNSNGLTSSFNKDSMYFVYESKLFKYTFANKVTKELKDLSSEVPLTTAVKITITPNEKYVVLTYKDKSQILNVGTGIMQSLCNNYCNEAVSQN